MTSTVAHEALLKYTRYSEFKRLVDQVASKLQQGGHKSVAILSELPGEGKTFFLNALAIGYNNLLGKRVLVVSTLVSNEADAPPGIKGIDIVSPHIENPDDPLETADFQVGQYILAARENYDLILADTCALSAANRRNVDPVVTARRTDTAILLTSPLSMTREALQATKARIDQWNIRLLGVVHNPGAPLGRRRGA